MTVNEQIKTFIGSQPALKRADMEELHQLVLALSPKCKLSFFDGKNSENKTVANPTIGYGKYTIRYANGTTADTFRIGLSANKTGISMYILGIPDKTYLASQFGKKIGKASVTGYCIRFKTLKEIDSSVLRAAIRYGMELGN